MATDRRSAVTLIEVLVALAILAILLALLLSAIQKVRVQALRAHASNGTRQVLLASHHYASTHQNLWPSVDGSLGPNNIPIPLSVIRALCPYLEADIDHPPEFIRYRSDPSLSLAKPEPPPPSPAPGGQPTHPPPPPPPGGLPIELQRSSHRFVTSLALNAVVYAKGTRLPSSISDGTAATIAITEHYGFCGQAQFDWAQLINDCYDPSMKKISCSSSSMRRSTFADGKMFQDVMPVTTQGENGPLTVGSLPLTFQVRPPLNQCDPRVPQSSFPGGILCGFTDGSVRFINQNVSQSAFWGSVTPDRGETVSLD